jgi:hypothetical protein
MAKSKSKFASVLPGLTKPEPEKTPYQERVEQVKAELATHPLTSLAEEYISLRKAKDELYEHEKALNLRIEACTQMLITSQESQEDGWGKYGVADNALRLPTGDTIRVKSEPSGVVKDKEAFRLWCIANGYETQLQLWPTTMNAIVKERCLEGEEPPAGTEIFRKDSLVFVAAKEGGDED